MDPEESVLSRVATVRKRHLQNIFSRSGNTHEILCFVREIWKGPVKSGKFKPIVLRMAQYGIFLAFLGRGSGAFGFGNFISV